jgi:hypothetical protein
MTAPFALSALKVHAVPPPTDTVPDSSAFVIDDLTEDQKPTRMVEMPPSFFDEDTDASAAPSTIRTPTPAAPREQAPAGQPADARPGAAMIARPPVTPPHRDHREVVPVPSPPAPVPSTAIELHRPPQAELRLEQAGAWQKIWLALQHRAWSSVALVPTGNEISEATVDIAQALCAVGLDHLRQPMSVLDVRQVSLGLAETRIAELRSRVARGERVLVVVGPMDENPACMPLATATDAAILCFKLGASHVREARKAVEALGRPRFLGAVGLRPRPAGKPGSSKSAAPGKP